MPSGGDCVSSSSDVIAESREVGEPSRVSHGVGLDLEAFVPFACETSRRLLGVSLTF